MKALKIKLKITKPDNKWLIKSLISTFRQPSVDSIKMKKQRKSTEFAGKLEKHQKWQKTDKSKKLKLNKPTLTVLIFKHSAK